MGHPEHETAVIRLHDQAEALTEFVEALARSTNDHEDWDAAVWLRRSLYDLWGARSAYERKHARIDGA